MNEESSPQGAETDGADFTFADLAAAEAKTPEPKTQADPEGEDKAKPADDGGKAPESESDQNPASESDANSDDKAKENSEGDVDPSKIEEEIKRIHALDPELAGNEAITKRYGEMVGGILKTVMQVNDDKQWLEDTLPKVAGMLEYAEALEDPEKALEAHRKLAEIAAKSTGIPLTEFLSAGKAEPSSLDEIMGVKDGKWDDAFESKEDYEGIKAMLQKAFEAGHASARKEAEPAVSSLKEQKQREREKQEFETMLVRTLPAVRAQVAKDLKGFEIDRKMLAEAITAFPAYAKDPMKAIKAHFLTEINAHLSKASEAPKPPEGIADSSTKGKKAIVDIDDLTFSNIGDV